MQVEADAQHAAIGSVLSDYVAMHDEELGFELKERSCFGSPVSRRGMARMPSEAQLSKMVTKDGREALRHVVRLVARRPPLLELIDQSELRYPGEGEVAELTLSVNDEWTLFIE